MDNTEMMELVEKNFSTSALADGGKLKPKQQKKFNVFIREYGGFLSKVNIFNMDRTQQQVDQLFIPEPVSESVDENVATTSNAGGVVDSKLLTVKKIKTKFFITTEFFQDNIEQSKAEETLMKAMGRRAAMDMEIVAINGDSSIVATDKLSLLLKRLDGWDKRTNGSHIVDVAGGKLQASVFHQMKKRLPKHYRSNRDLSWIMSTSLFDEWLALTSARSTNYGDFVLQEGKAPRILGLPVLQVPAIPDDKALKLTSGLPAELVGNRQGHFQFSNTNNVLIIQINASANDRTITFPIGVIDPPSTAKAINDVLIFNNEPAIAYSDPLGHIVIRTTTLGLASSIIVQIGSTAAATLGIDGALPLTFSGVDAATAGNISEGTFMWLADPKNFYFGLLNATRIYKKFNEDNDRLEITMYNQIDANIGDLDGIVKASNIRIQTF